MPRKGPVGKREIKPDTVYNSELVSRFIKKILKKGKKSLAERIVYDAFDILKERTKKDPMRIFEQGLKNVVPHIVVKSRRVGGATYQVPVEMRKDKGTSLALRWIVDFSKKRQGKTMSEKLADEILDASNNTGASVKKREDTHKMAEANKAFAHYRW